MKHIFTIAFLLIAMSCSKSDSKSTNLNGAGATFPYPIYAAWSFDYYKSEKIKLNYQSIGSGGGVKQITNRTVDFGASDAPVPAEKLVEEKLLQFPAIIGGVVPIVNIPNVAAGQLKLSSEVLAKIYMNEITMWNDPAIVADNEGIELPAKEITTVQRSDGSGTTAIFTNFLGVVYPKFEEKIGMGKAVKWIGGVGAKGNEGVANYVKKLEYSIGYVEYAYAKQNNLSDVQLRNKAGNFVSPNVESFMAAGASAEWNPDNHFYLWMINAPGENSWPITGASFILMAQEKPEVNKNVIKFFEWCFQNGDKTAVDKTYIPLPEELKTKVRAYWATHVK
jgi:phosphate transport system substrate-binding protein